VFHSKLTRRPVPPGWNYSSPFEYIAANPAEWREYHALAELVESITVERPHIYLGPVDPCLALPPRAPRPWAGLGAPFAAVSGEAPALAGFTGLQVLTDVPRLLRADKVHIDGIRGKGVRVVMIDSGFAHGHPFFVANGFHSRVCLSPLLDAQTTSFDLDRRGHGTGESANLFAVAPGVELTGIKLTPDAAGNDSALLAPFHHAVASRPHVISLSIAFDLCDRGQHVPETTLRESLLSLENEIRLAVASGIVVVAGAGNGQFGFPAQMPEVIAAGGVFADDPRLANPPGEGPPALRASNFASAFKSRIARYDGRKVPDCCGLVGEQPDAAYILLPLPPGSEQDRDGSIAAGAGARARRNRGRRRLGGLQRHLGRSATDRWRLRADARGESFARARRRQAHPLRHRAARHRRLGALDGRDPERAGADRRRRDRRRSGRRLCRRRDGARRGRAEAGRRPLACRG
jgi:hypothetical protein